MLLQRPFGCNRNLYSLICACTLEFVFNEYSNLHKGAFKSKVKHRILNSHATGVLHTMAVTWKGGCEAYMLSVMHLNEHKITDEKS